ncbi:DUF2735 domain-containing protein [uncultured Roseibium sp.]|uniref:DUF2735 domain-containing protein n=1 Tax=uncultured Roseibium sp. TaxID=1936171 RepID=UPI003217F122
MTTAKILQFPIGGRAAKASQRSYSSEFERKASFAVEMPRIAAAALDGAWYHEQAVSENDTERKH